MLSMLECQIVNSCKMLLRCLSYLFHVLEEVEDRCATGQVFAAG